MADDIKKMTDRIAKLLAKAEGTDNPHEAETYSAHAEKLMLKLGIAEADIRAKMGDTRPADKVVTKHTPQFDKLFIKARMGIAAEVASAMGNMRCYITGGNRVAIIGYESDVDRALMLISSILLQADHAQAVWWRSYELRRGMKASEQFRARRQFLFSYRVAVGKRIRELYREAVEEATEPGTALVLRNKAADVNEEFMKLSLRAGRRLKGSWTGAAEGSAAGNAANIGGASLGDGARGALEG